MGEEQKVEEPKAEEAKPVEKKEESAEEKPAAEVKKEEPKPPSPFVLSMDLHCVGCAKKIERCLLRIAGVVGVEIDMVKNQVTIKGVVEPQAVCDKIIRKTKRSAKVLSPLPAAEGESIPQVLVSQVPGLTTVELNVNMHCEACAEQLKRRILRMKGVRRVEAEVSSGKVMVTGSMEGEKLVDYVYRHTKKQARIVPQPEAEPAPEPEPEPELEPEKPKEEAAAEKEEAGKVEEKAGEEEKPAEEEKKEGGGGGEEKEKIKKDDGGEREKAKELGDEQSMQLQRMMYYHNYPPLYVMERIPPPQLFSDENPNACSIS